MTTTVPTAGDEERLVAELREDASAWHDVELGVRLAGAIDLITRLRQERDDARALAERLKLEAQCHASEARAANSTIYEIYQVISGNWNGAEPVRQFVTASNAEAERLRADIAQATDLMRKAHAVMRECGWQLAVGAEPAGDGILEAACTEIEADFGDFLGSAKQ